jgi:hypothetical protein
VDGSWYESRGETFGAVMQATTCGKATTLLNRRVSDWLAPPRTPRLLERVQEPLVGRRLNRLAAISRKQTLRHLMKNPLT